MIETLRTNRRKIGSRSFRRMTFRNCARNFNNRKHDSKNGPRKLQIKNIRMCRKFVVNNTGERGFGKRSNSSMLWALGVRRAEKKLPSMKPYAHRAFHNATRAPQARRSCLDLARHSARQDTPRASSRSNCSPKPTWHCR